MLLTKVSRWRLLFYLVILSNTLRIFWIPLGMKIRWTCTGTSSQPRNSSLSIEECKRALSQESAIAVLNNRTSSSPPFVPGGLRMTAEWRSARHIVPDFCDVDRLDVTTLSLETFLLKYIKARRPVVLTGAARDWPATTQWRRSHLLATRRDQEWRVVRPPYLDPSGGAYRFETLSDFLEEMASTINPMPNVSANTRVPVSYLFEMVQGLNLSRSTGRCASYETAPDACAGNQVNVQDSICCFLGDTRMPDTLLRAVEEASQRSASSIHDNKQDQGLARSGSPPGSASAGLMIGPAQSGLPFHQHDLAINALIHGEKRWFLFPEAQDPIGQDLAEQHLYGLGANVDALGWALQNFEVVDMSVEQWRWTGNAEIGKRILQCAQHESDVFIVPRGWHHAVINVADSICLNYQPGNI